MPEQTQIFAGAFGDLFTLLTQLRAGEVSESYAQNAQWEIFTSLCMEFQVNEDDLLWLISFLTAGPSRVGRPALPAAAPSSAGRGSSHDDAVTYARNTLDRREGRQAADEWSDTNVEARNADQ
jgi:hypothetical protein